MSARPLCASLLALALGLCLGACGGAGSSSSSTAATAATSEPSPPASTPTAAAKPHAPSAAALAAQRRRAGAAAPFVKARADNSVPTFGAEAAPSQRRQAEATLQAYLRSRAREDWASACRYLAAPTREGYEKLAKSKASGCAPILAALSKGAELSDPLTGALLALRVHGQNAFALFYGPHHQQYIVPMNREAGKWRLTQTSAIAYPPGAPTTTP